MNRMNRVPGPQRSAKRCAADPGPFRTRRLERSRTGARFAKCEIALQLMPENKLQHYVPKCHLRPFSLDSERSAINLYNIARGRLIKGAPIKGQCARSYFYGTDPLLERALQEPEGAYAAVVAKVTCEPSSITSEDLACLREFTLLQTFRTYGYVEKLIAMADQHYADIKAAAPGKPVPPRVLENVEDAVNMAMRHFVDCRQHVRDLRTCLILNEARREFVTSDDPAIHINQFHFQKLKSDAFELSSAGAMFFLPLTPKAAFIAFDDNIYFAPNWQGNTLVVSRDEEVSELNELQILHSRQNLYYANPETGETLAAEFKELAAVRPAVWHKFKYFEKVRELEKEEIYRPVKTMTLEPGRHFLTSFQQVHVQPNRWTSLLKYRLRPRFVNTGTGAGCVRPNHPLLREKKRSWRRQS